MHYYLIDTDSPWPVAVGPFPSGVAALLWTGADSEAPGDTRLWQVVRLAEPPGVRVVDPSVEPFAG